jgi:hypothetical protein
MHTQTRTLLPAVLFATLTLLPLCAHAEVPPPPPPAVTAPAEPAPAAEVAAQPQAETPPSTRYVGLHTGLNLGLVQVDMMRDHLYGFASTALGTPLLSNGQIFVANVGFGYSIAISSPGESMWYFDLFGQVMPGAMNGSYLGVGAGVGLRYLHRSGFTLGLKLPVFGMSLGDAVSSAAGGHFDGSTSLGYYYLGNLMSATPLTIGFRF